MRNVINGLILIAFLSCVGPEIFTALLGLVYLFATFYVIAFPLSVIPFVRKLPLFRTVYSDVIRIKNYVLNWCDGVKFPEDSENEYAFLQVNKGVQKYYLHKTTFVVAGIFSVLTFVVLKDRTAFDQFCNSVLHKSSTDVLLFCWVFWFIFMIVNSLYYHFKICRSEVE